MTQIALIAMLAAVMASPCPCKKICALAAHKCLAKDCPGRADPPAARYRHDGRALLPDAHYTPGAVIKGENPCAPGFRTSKIRNVPQSEKRAVYAEYGAVEKKGVCCEVDHLISLELGGSNSIKNLWPQPYLPKPGAHEKDLVEDELHSEVCRGVIPLDQAQSEISTDWYKVYERLNK
jgi:hypothetical protein